MMREIKNLLKKILRKLKKLRYRNKKEVITWLHRDIFDVLTPDDIAIDCGANTGREVGAMVASGAKIYAFEPNPFAFKVLKNEYSKNKNVECINKGVLDKNTTMKLYLHELSDEDEVKWSSGSSLLEFKKNVKKEKFVDIDVIDIVDFIKNLDRRVKILKMDVEGVEIEIINKLIDTGIINQIDLVLVETHDDRIPELKKSTNKLRKRIKKEKIKNINLNWE